MAALTDVQALGYVVTEARPSTDDSAAVMYVTGFGLETYVAADDQATIDSLADPAAFAARRQWFENPSEA